VAEFINKGVESCRHLRQFLRRRKASFGVSSRVGFHFGESKPKRSRQSQRSRHVTMPLSIDADNDDDDE